VFVYRGLDKDRKPCQDIVMGKHETPMSVNQSNELLDLVIERLEEEDYLTSDKLDDIIHESADSFVPVYYTEQVDEWRTMGCPEPEMDSAPDAGIFDRIALAIYETALDWLLALASEVSETDTLEEVASAFRAVRTAFGVNEGYDNLAKAILA